MNRKLLTANLESRQGIRVPWVAAVVVAFATVLVGCGDSGPKLVDAKGKVTYKGEPLPKAQVVFVPEGNEITALAMTDEQGEFQITTEGRPGAVPGKYKVAITAIKLLKEIPPERAGSMSNEEIYANQKSLIPQKYNNGISSGLTADVSEDPSQNQFAFDLQ